MKGGLEFAKKAGNGTFQAERGNMPYSRRCTVKDGLESAKKGRHRNASGGARQHDVFAEMHGEKRFEICKWRENLCGISRQTDEMSDIHSLDRTA